MEKAQKIDVQSECDPTCNSEIENVECPLCRRVGSATLLYFGLIAYGSEDWAWDWMVEGGEGSDLISVLELIPNCCIDHMLSETFDEWTIIYNVEFAVGKCRFRD